MAFDAGQEKRFFEQHPLGACAPRITRRPRPRKPLAWWQVAAAVREFFVVPMGELPKNWATESGGSAAMAMTDRSGRLAALRKGAQ